MGIQEVETAIKQLPSPQLTELAAWLEEYQWDRQIEEDTLAGRLNALGEQADRELEAGRCRSL